MEEYLFLIALGVIAVAAIVAGVMIRSHFRKKDTHDKKQKNKKHSRRKKNGANGSVKRIRWSENFVVDNSVIDRDHKTLFVLVNQFNRNIQNFQSVQHLMPVLASLTKYIETHFQREEQLQRMVQYPFLEDHREEHKNIIRKFGELVKTAKDAKERDVGAVATEIGSFLEQWITGHVIDSDLLMRPFVERMRKHTGRMGRLK